MSIIKLNPAFKDYLWGGTKLKEKYGKKTDMDPVAESWELSVHPDGPSIVASGEYEGLSFPEYLEKKGKSVLGTKGNTFEFFPILIKFIDAKQPLSIQVHPDNEYALRVEHEYGKTEMWYILDCEPDSFLYFGVNKEISKEEFERYVYWHGNFGMHFKTMTHAYTGEKFAVMCDMDAVSIVEKRDKYAKNLPYRKFSAKEMEEIATYSSKSDECWHMLGETLHDQYGYDVEETEEMIDHLRKIVMEGNGVQELWDVFQDEESTLIEQVEMWQCLLNAELETHLPMLNGYSRMEYEKKTGTNAFSIMLFDESRLDKDIKRDTGLQKLPLKTQEMIYRAFFENIIGKDRIKALEQVKKKIQTENDGLNFLIGMCYMAIEKYSKANSIIEEIADRTQDESAFTMLDMMDDSLVTAMYGNDYYYDEWDAFAGVGMNEPYQREAKKIGRNDSCPCGSGKKYKKCCGR